MCEDQGMAIFPWAALGGGQLMTTKQRAEQKNNPNARIRYGSNELDIKVSEVLERIADRKATTLQAIVSIYRHHERTDSLKSSPRRLPTYFNNLPTSFQSLVFRRWSMSKRYQTHFKSSYRRTKSTRFTMQSPSIRCSRWPFSITGQGTKTIPSASPLRM